MANRQNSLHLAPVRLLRIVVVLSLLVLIPFFIWGDQLMELFRDATKARMWIENYGPWGWLEATCGAE